MINEKDFWSEKIPFIKNLKDFFSQIEHKGINLWPIMADETYTFYRNQDVKFFERFARKIKYLFFRENYLVVGSPGGILASYFMPRKDHHDFFLKAIEKFHENELLLLDCYENKMKNPLLRGSFNFPNLVLLFKIWRKFKKAKLKDTLGKYYSLFLTRTYSRFRKIEQFYEIYNKYTPCAHIAFCSQAFGEDSIITLIHKKEGKPTFNLQHGFTIEYPDFNPISVLNENIISDYNLVWGESTYDIQKKYVDKKRLIIAGNPKYSLRDLREGQTEFIPKNATIFLSVKGNEESNKDIVRILNGFAEKHPEITFGISAHPFDNINNYTNLISAKNITPLNKDAKIKEILEKSDFIVIHNTTIAYEALLYAIPIFRFGDKALKDLWSNDDKFTNLADFERIFNNLKDKTFYKNQIKFYKKELNKNMYFDSRKDPSQVYHDKIVDCIKSYNKMKDTE
jgi:hypothetical protein